MSLARKRPSRKTSADVFGFDVLLADEARERFRQRLRSRHWWVLIADADGFPDVARIKARFYTGEASGDFEAWMPPGCPGLAIFFAQKRRMSPEQLYALYLECEGPSAITPGSTVRPKACAGAPCAGVYRPAGRAGRRCRPPPACLRGRGSRSVVRLVYGVHTRVAVHRDPRRKARHNYLYAGGELSRLTWQARPRTAATAARETDVVFDAWQSWRDTPPPSPEASPG
jgi:hypothetical protein